MAEERDVTDVYTDSFRLTVGAYGVALSFGLNPPHPETSRPPVAKDQAIIRMSLENAKVLAMLLRQNLKGYEHSQDLEIPLPPGLYTQLGIAKEDWGS